MNTWSKNWALALFTFGLAGYIYAEPMHAMSSQGKGYKSEYQTSMQTMEHEMMPAMQASNPDVAFAQGMLAHHKGAVKMAQIQLKYGHDQQMLTLAKNIIREQNAQILILEKWLQQHPQH